MDDEWTRICRRMNKNWLELFNIFPCAHTITHSVCAFVFFRFARASCSNRKHSVKDDSRVKAIEQSYSCYNKVQAYYVLKLMNRHRQQNQHRHQHHHHYRILYKRNDTDSITFQFLLMPHICQAFIHKFSIRYLHALHISRMSCEHRIQFSYSIALITCSIFRLF